MLSTDLRTNLLSDVELVSPAEMKSDSSATAIVPARVLRYLNVFKKEQELLDLEKEFKRTRFELDAALDDFTGWYWFERVQNWLACGSGLLIISFVITTSNDAFIKVAKTTIDVDLPEELANSISIPVAVLSTGLFFVSFSCKKEAVKTLLAYAYRKPFYQRTYEFLHRVRQHPGLMALHSGQYLTNRSVMALTNVTASVTLIVNIKDLLGNLPEPLNMAAPLTILYYGERFFAKYLNSNYMKGLEFFQHLWRGERKHHGFTRPMQSVLQVFSSTALRVFPYYYWLAQRANEMLGWYPHEYLVMACVTLHSIVLFYPSAFNYYFTDQEAVEKILKERFPNLSAAELAEKYQEEKALLHQAMLTEFGQLYVLKKELMFNLVLAYDAFIGGYMGYELGLMATDEQAIPIILSVMLASFFGGTLYNAEEKRVAHQLYKKILEHNPEQAPARNTANEKMAAALGTTINLTTSVSIVTSIISTSTDLASGFLRSSIYLGAGKRGLNIFFLNQPKITDTMQALTPPGNVFKSAWMWFFKKPQQAATPAAQRAITIRPNQT